MRGPTRWRHCKVMVNFSFDRPLAAAGSALGPFGPFPNVALNDEIDRRWLHYAFLSRDGRNGMVANMAWLGPAEGEPPGIERLTTILLLHETGGHWVSSQFNADVVGTPWSAFRLPHVADSGGPLRISGTSGTPRIDLQLRRTSRPCSSQCAFFSGHEHLRWQSEPGVRAAGDWNHGTGNRKVDLVGYHERVRGRWSWPDLGEWVFGFANDLASDPRGPPSWAAVFTFIRPTGNAREATASFMLWKAGRMQRHFPRRCVSFAVRGELERNQVALAPPLARSLGIPPMAPIPRRLAIIARQGDDEVILDFDAEAAVRVIVSSENSLRPFSVHEVIGGCLLAGKIGDERFSIQTRGIVEFAGGAGGD